jgi:FSR family fosmidomycin resistance protein-like MFS transporter
VKIRLKSDGVTVICFSLTHGLIDFACSLVVYNAAIVHGLPPPKAVAMIIAYDLIAFAAQPLAGFFLDHKQAFRPAMATGIVITLSGVILMAVNAYIAAAAAGIGNALFHLGAGAQILRRYQNTATAIGIFAGPGALGLSLGFWFGNRGFFPFWHLTIGLVAACLSLTALPALKAGGPVLKEGGPYPGKNRLIVISLLLSAIAIRGFSARAAFAGLPSDAFMVIGLGLAACVGKMAGGSAADRLGRVRAVAGALPLSLIGIGFAPYHACIAFVAMLLLQMTMPITLGATSEALPGKPAFAFGLTCLALIVGTLFAFSIPIPFIRPQYTLALVAVSGICIVSALSIGCCRSLPGFAVNPPLSNAPKR